MSDRQTDGCWNQKHQGSFYPDSLHHFFLFIITAMRKGSGCHGDSFSNIFVGQLKVESAHICVCDVWFPGATNGVDESSGHYVEASRALETFPLHFSLTLAISFPFISSLHPGPTRLTKALQWQQWKQGRESAGQVEMNEAETTGVLTGTIHAGRQQTHLCISQKEEGTFNLCCTYVPRKGNCGK